VALAQETVRSGGATPDELWDAPNGDGRIPATGLCAVRGGGVAYLPAGGARCGEMCGAEKMMYADTYMTLNRWHIASGHCRGLEGWEADTECGGV